MCHGDSVIDCWAPHTLSVVIKLEASDMTAADTGIIFCNIKAQRGRETTLVHARETSAEVIHGAKAEGVVLTCYQANENETCYP